MTNSIKYISLYSENDFMPKRIDPGKPLTDHEERFLEIYVRFAKGMKTLIEYKKFGYKPNSERVVKEKKQVIRSAAFAAIFLRRNPFSDMTATNNMIGFLYDTATFIKITLP